jgi:hypothetical protein
LTPWRDRNAPKNGHSRLPIELFYFLLGELKIAKRQCGILVQFSTFATLHDLQLI